MWKYSIIQRNSKQIIWKVYEREVNYRWLDDGKTGRRGKFLCGFMWSDFCVVLSSFLKSITQCVHPRTHDFDEKFVNVFDYWEIKWMLSWRKGKSFSSSFFFLTNVLFPLSQFHAHTHRLIDWDFLDFGTQKTQIQVEGQKRSFNAMMSPFGGLCCMFLENVTCV